MIKNFTKRIVSIGVAIVLSMSNVMTVSAQSGNNNVQCTIKDEKKVLNSQQEEFIQKVFEENFLKMWEKYGYQNQAPNITFIMDSSLVPGGYSGAEIGDGKIAFVENSFSNINEYSEGLIIHEMSHVVQEYQNVKTFDWLSEGLADYISSEYSEQKLSLIPTQYTQGELYDGYLTTAGFLKWMEKGYPGSVMKLHRTMQQGAIEYETFSDLTGKTLVDLWKEYSGKSLISIEQYLLNIAEASDYPEYKKRNALERLGKMYMSGEVVPKDLEKALFYFAKVVENKNLPEEQKKYAMAKIGDIYYYEYNDPQAVIWYERAQDYGGVKLVLGYIYLAGELVEKDVQKAYACYLDIVNNENLSEDMRQQAMAKIGDIYYYEYNDPQAVTWYEKAENYGDGGVKLVLGNIYLEGKIVQKDIQKAHSYFWDIIQSADTKEEYKKYATDALNR